MDKLLESMTQRGRALSERENGPRNFTHHPDYDGLCESFRRTMSPKEFAWMPDVERAMITERMCYPEIEED